MPNIDVIKSLSDEYLLSKLDDIIELAATKGNSTAAAYLYEVKQRFRRIVLCKDCKHVVKTPGGLLKCGNYFRAENWYCADGVKRDESV